MKARVPIANAVTLVLELESLDYTKSVIGEGETTVFVYLRDSSDVVLDAKSRNFPMVA
jgi:hypothetical protein